MKKIVSILSTIFLLSAILSSCTDLEENPYSSIPSDEFFNNEEEFLMSAGTALLWEEDAELRAMLNAVVDGIAECADEDGYLIPIAKKHFNEKEYPNYVRAWLIFGLLAAGAAGNDKAYKLCLL